MNKIKILTIFGTRPEVIKLAPFIKAVENDADCISVTCATAQHRELQNNILELFNIKADYNLDIMKAGQDLFYVTNAVLKDVKAVIERENPDVMVVQGDTTTAFAAALAGFYAKIPVVHIEAGLRTGRIDSPFPEEANRSLISKIASLHMAPTQEAKENLEKEGISSNVFMVGNTIVDSVRWGVENFKVEHKLVEKIIKAAEKTILITVHRRENFGEPLKEICAAIKEICQTYTDYKFIWPVHPNPNVKPVVFEALGNISNLTLLEPLPYSDLLLLINASSLILSDSGGIQEEACILGKKIIVLRENTERMEIIREGIGVLAGSKKEKIVQTFNHFMSEKNGLLSSNKNFLYGAPGVSNNILKEIKRIF